MKNFWTLLVLLLISTTTFAQYTDVINSKRPGSSESPYAVGTDVFQAEAGIFFGNSKSTIDSAKINPMGGTLFLRYGKLSEKLEINANIAFQQNDLHFNNPMATSQTVSGLSQLNVGLKYMIYEKEYEDRSKEIRSWKKRHSFDKSRLIPTVGIYAGVNTNFVEEVYQDENMSYKAALLLQNDFTDRLVLLSNLVVDRISTDNQFYSYILTLTYGFGNEWSIFAENQGEFYENNNQLFVAGGLAYLVSRNLQLDAFARTNFDSLNSELIIGIGVSWRLDMHVDEEIAPEGEGTANGKEPKDMKKSKGRKKKKGKNKEAEIETPAEG